MASPSRPAPHHLQPPPALPDLIDELLEEFFVRLPTAADLARASMACTSFRRIIVGHAFLRRFRHLHPPPLLGILTSYRGFLAAQPPHAPAAAARAFADPDPADLSCSFIPSPDRWRRRDFRDGRFLLSAIPEGSKYDRRAFVRSFAVCDPLYRRYLLLPAIPDDLAALVHQSDKVVFEPFHCAAAEDDEDTLFRVICFAQCRTKLIVFIFSRGIGQWHAGISNPFPSWEPPLSKRHYAHGCFFWLRLSINKVLVLDTHSFEFSFINLPPGSPAYGIDIVEAVEGKLGLFTLCCDLEESSYFLWYTILQNDHTDTKQSFV